MAKEEKTNFRDQKYSNWHRSLPHNHLMLDFDMLDLLNRTMYGVFSGYDLDGDDICKCLFECKEIQFSGSYYYLPHIDKNQAGCLRSFCKRYDKDGNRWDIPFFVVSYSIDLKLDKRWFVVHSMNSACHKKLEEFSNKKQKTIAMSEDKYISFLSFLIGKNIYRDGSNWLPDKSIVV